MKSTPERTLPEFLAWLLFGVNEVYGSVTLVLDDSVANSEPEEGLALVVHVRLDVVWLSISQHLHFFSGGLIWEWCNYLGLLDLFVFEEFIESCLSDWDYLLNNVPEDTF